MEPNSTAKNDLCLRGPAATTQAELDEHREEHWRASSGKHRTLRGTSEGTSEGSSEGTSEDQVKEVTSGSITMRAFLRHSTRSVSVVS